MGKFDRRFRSLHKRIINLLLSKHGTHGHIAIGNPLRNRHQIRHHSKIIRPKSRPHSTKPGNHLVKDQHNPMTIANRAKFFQIALRRNQHARRACNGFDNHCRNVRSIMKRNDAFQIVGKMSTPLRLSF